MRKGWMYTATKQLEKAIEAASARLTGALEVFNDYWERDQAKAPRGDGPRYRRCGRESKSETS